MRFNFLLIAFIAAAGVRGQTRPTDLACVYITSTNLDSSSAFYEKIGFTQTGSNTFPNPWVQLSDGSLVIMIRQDPKPYIGLTYYSSDADRLAVEWEKKGLSFSQRPGAGDAIRRYYLTSPDGFSVVLAQNIGGFSQPAGKTLMDMKPDEFSNIGKYPNPDCGAFGEFCHPVKDLEKSLEFWKKLGFEVKSKMTSPYPHAILYDGRMIVGLHQTKDFDYPAITYFGVATEKRITQLKAKGITAWTPFMGNLNQVLKTWEGQHIFLFSIF